MTYADLQDRIVKLLRPVDYITGHTISDPVNGEIVVAFETADQLYCVTSKTVTIKTIAMLPEVEYNLGDYRKSLWDLRTLLYNVASAVRVYGECNEGVL